MSKYKEEIYKKITLYYDIAEKLKIEILGLEGLSDQDRFDVLMPIVEEIKKIADTLMEKYIYFLKDSSNSMRKDIINILDEFLEYIAIYKNKLYEIYNK